MDKKQASVYAKEGYELFIGGKYLEAEKKYIKALELSEPDYWRLPDYHIEYAMILKALGKKTEETEQLELSLESALKTDDKNSVTVTVARHALAEHLLMNGNYKKVLEVLEPALNMECEQKWLLCYVASRANYLLGNIVKYEELASQIMFLAPKGKYSSLKNLLLELSTQR